MFTAAYFPPLLPSTPGHELFRKAHDALFRALVLPVTMGEQIRYAVLQGAHLGNVQICLCGSTINGSFEDAIWSPSYVFDFATNEDIDNYFAVEGLLNALGTWLNFMGDAPLKVAFVETPSNHPFI